MAYDGAMAGIARLIIAETSGRWAPGLRAELAGTGVRLWQAGTIETAWQWLAESPASMLVIELTPRNARDLLDRLQRAARDWPLARVMVVAPRGLAHGEGLLREAGAVHVECSPRRVDRLAAIACRHLAGAPEEKPQSLTERVWASLPWGDKAAEQGL
jgi:hypothetical protein